MPIQRLGSNKPVIRRTVGGTANLTPIVGTGAKGTDGSNVLPTDTAIGAAITTPGSATAIALAASIDLRIPWLDVEKYGAKNDGVTDDTTAINAALAAATPGSCVVFQPGGGFVTTGNHAVPSGVTVLGFSRGGQLAADGAPLGSVVLCKPGSTPTAMFTFNGAGVTFQNLQINGMDRAVKVISGHGFQNRIDGCDIRRGTTYGLHITNDPNGHENKIVDTDVTMNQMGVGIRYEGSSTEPSHDNTLVNITVRGAPRCLELVRSSANQLIGCHFYSYPAVSTDCLVYIDNATLNQFVGCYFDGIRGPAVKMYADTGAIDQTQFVGCLFPSFISAGAITDNTVPVIEVKHSTYGVTNTVFVGNTVAGASSSQRYSFVINAIDGGGDPRGMVFTGNNCRNVANLVNPPAAIQGGNVLAGIAVGIAYRLTNSYDPAFALQRVGEAFSRFYMDGDAILSLGPGTAARDVSIRRTAAKVLSLGADNLFRTGTYATSGRPAANSVGQGAQYFDTTLNRPVWSDGGTWRDAAGNVV